MLWNPIYHYILSNQDTSFGCVHHTHTDTHKIISVGIASPVQKCHNKKFKIPGGACKQRQRATGANMNIQVSDLSPCGLCQIEEISHPPQALMPPASLSLCAILECGLYIWRNRFGKCFFSSLSYRKLPIHANIKSQGKETDAQARISS